MNNLPLYVIIHCPHCEHEWELGELVHYGVGGVVSIDHYVCPNCSYFWSIREIDHFLATKISYEIKR